MPYLLRFTRFCRSPKPEKLTLQLLVSNRAEIAERRMSTYLVVKALHQLEERLPGLPSGLKASALHTLALERSEKRFGHSVAVTVACAAHAHRHTCFCQQRSISVASVL
jgi:hypothetical protein